MNNPDRYIDRVQDLPPAPTIATELLGLFDDPDRDLDQIVELISHDPSLTVKVMKHCNSTFFCGSQPVADMFDAVTRLGFHEVYYVVAALVGVHTMSLGKSRNNGLDVGSLWCHSVQVAVAAKTVAIHVQDSEAVPFTAGLLHDIGKLVFASTEGLRYASLMKQAGTFGSDLGDAEQAAFGVNHSAIGMRLLTRWGLPENIATAVRHHHASPGAAQPFGRLSATVQLANHLAHHISEDAPPLAELLLCDQEAKILLGLTDEDVPILIAQTQSGLERVKGLLHLAV